MTDSLSNMDPRDASASKNEELGLKATAGFIFKSFNPCIEIISQMMVCKLCRTFDVSTGDHSPRCLFQINSKQTDFQLPSNYNQAAMICWKRPHGDLFHSRPSTQATLLSSTVNHAISVVQIYILYILRIAQTQL